MASQIVKRRDELLFRKKPRNLRRNLFRTSNSQGEGGLSFLSRDIRNNYYLGAIDFRDFNIGILGI